MAYINYNEYDTKILEDKDFKTFIKAFSIDVLDEEVWSVARENTEIPSFEEILLQMYFSRLDAAIKSKIELLEISEGVDIPYNIKYYNNFADSSFMITIDNHEVYNFDDMMDEIKRHIEKNQPEGTLSANRHY